MVYEIKAYYNNGVGTRAMVDKERSTPKKEIPAESAEAYMKLLEAMGAKRHETMTQVFYDKVEDSTHSTEYIFYKR